MNFLKVWVLLRCCERGCDMHGSLAAALTSGEAAMGATQVDVAF